MTWLAWRLQRSETLLTLLGFALLAGIFVPAGLHLASLYTHDGVAACVGRHTRVCAYTIGRFADHAGALRGGLGWFNLLPGLMGVALAAPFALDLESGTATFAWTQGVPRGRWLATKLGVPVVTAVAAGGAYSLLFSWARSPLDTLFGRFTNSVFDFEGTVPIAYFLFALGIGLAVGVVWRRTAPAMVVAFLAYFGGRIFVDMWLRQRFVTPLTTTFGLRSPVPKLDRAWVLFEGPSNRAGVPFSGGFQVLQQCGGGLGNGGLKAVNQTCLARHGAGFSHVVYQPASRFWEFQGIETALFGGLAILLIAFAAWRVLRSD